jgi:iron complex outermembrane receptor protein
MRSGKSGICPVALSAALFLIGSLLFFFAAPVEAKDQTSDDASDRASYDLGSITVTAQKQEENVQDVSSRITVIDTMDIEDKKIESMADLIDFVPNMMLFNDGMTAVNTITARGLAAPTMARSTTSAGMYIDGVPTLGSFAYEEGMVDIERIEVLRGPQGTLYGKNTEAGAINI